MVRRLVCQLRIWRAKVGVPMKQRSGARGVTIEVKEQITLGNKGLQARER